MNWYTVIFTFEGTAGSYKESVSGNSNDHAEKQFKEDNPDCVILAVYLD